MSHCISSHGEYSDCDPDQDFICKRCFALDEDALFAKVERLNATIERVKALLDEDYHAALLLDQGHVLMSAKADGMRLVIAHIRAALESPAEQKLVM